VGYRDHNNKSTYNKVGKVVLTENCGHLQLDGVNAFGRQHQARLESDGKLPQNMFRVVLTFRRIAPEPTDGTGLHFLREAIKEQYCETRVYQKLSGVIDAEPTVSLPTKRKKPCTSTKTTSSDKSKKELKVVDRPKNLHEYYHDQLELHRPMLPVEFKSNAAVTLSDRRLVYELAMKKKKLVTLKFNSAAKECATMLDERERLYELGSNVNLTDIATQRLGIKISDHQHNIVSDNEQNFQAVFAHTVAKNDSKSFKEAFRKLSQKTGKMGDLVMYGSGGGTNAAGSFGISDLKKMKVDGAGLVLENAQSLSKINQALFEIWRNQYVVAVFVNDILLGDKAATRVENRGKFMGYYYIKEQHGCSGMSKKEYKHV
jgi:hypothetical protein